jgi:hypothetical protein
VSELEAAWWERTRLLAALLGCDAPPPGVLAPVLGGAVLAAVVVAIEVARRWW